MVEKQLSNTPGITNTKTFLYFQMYGVLKLNYYVDVFIFPGFSPNFSKETHFGILYSAFLR